MPVMRLVAPGPSVPRQTPGAAGEAPVDVGHEGGALLVAHDHDLDRGVAQGLDDLEGLLPGDREDALHALRPRGTAPSAPPPAPRLPGRFHTRPGGYPRRYPRTSEATDERGSAPWRSTARHSTRRSPRGCCSAAPSTSQRRSGRRQPLHRRDHRDRRRRRPRGRRRGRRRGPPAPAPAPAAERAAILERAARLVAERAETFARTICLEAGKPMKQARARRPAASTRSPSRPSRRGSLAGEVVPMDAQLGRRRQARRHPPRADRRRRRDLARSTSR